MITVSDIRAAYGLKSASFTLDRGLVALVGPNGSGKTTLLKALAGLVSVHGKMHVDGPVSYLPQTQEFLETMTVADVVALGRAPYRGRLSRLSEQDQTVIALAMLQTGTSDFAARPIGELSGGERARVGLARALATQASALLADEPTASLDLAHALDMMDRLRTIGENSLVVCAVHDIALARRFAARVLVMSEGRLVADGSAELLDGSVVADVFGISPPAGGWQTATRAAKPRS